MKAEAMVETAYGHSISWGNFIRGLAILGNYEPIRIHGWDDELAKISIKTSKKDGRTSASAVTDSDRATLEAIGFISMFHGDSESWSVDGVE